MARKEKDLQNGMNSMLGYATQPGQNKADTKNEQTAAVVITPQDTPEQTTSKDKSKPKYLRLDISNLENYVSLMAEREHISMTKYIRKLIEADKQLNNDLYEKLKQIDNMKREIM